MTPPAEPAKSAAETHLQRTLTSVINGLPVDAALAAIIHQEQGPLTGHVTRGFTPVPASDESEPSRTVRLRLVSPGAKSLLSIPLRHRQRTYGFLVIGRKDNAAFAKKDKLMIEQASDEVTKALDREGQFDMNVVLSRPFVAHEPGPPPGSPAELFTATV